MTKQKRRGVTITNVLICCICCSILASLAFVVINRIREQSKITTCQDRLRTIGFLAAGYADAHVRLPPSTLGAKGSIAKESWGTKSDDLGRSKDFWRNYQNTSSLAMTIEYLDGNQACSQVDPINFSIHKTLATYRDKDNKRIYEWQGDIRGVQNAAKKVVPEFVCPSDNINEDDISELIIATQPYLDPKDENDDLGIKIWPDGDGDQFKCTNYLANGGVGGAHYQGPMRCRKKMTLVDWNRMKGDSYTVLYAETIGEIVDGRRIRAMSWMWGGEGRGRGALPHGYANYPGNSERRNLGDARWSSGIGFGSMHPNGVNMILTDLSVHNCSRSIHMKALYHLFGSANGKFGGNNIRDNIQENLAYIKQGRAKRATNDQ